MSPIDSLRSEVCARLTRMNLYQDNPTDWAEWLEKNIMADINNVEREFLTFKIETECYVNQLRDDLNQLHKLYT